MAETNILIVEDERILAEDLKDILLALGYGVCGSTGSGEAAVDLAEKTKTDLVLMDIKLDGTMDGIDTAHVMIRRLGIPVIYTTAYSDDAILQRAKETEPSGYIIKPYRASEIKSVIEIALFKTRVEKERKTSHDQLAEKAKQDAEHLHEMQSALKILMEYREKEKSEILRSVAKNLNDRVLAHFDTIRMRWPNEDLNELLGALEVTITEIASSMGSKIPGHVHLTPMEHRVIDLIRQGRTSKEIATLLGITVRGVTFHRGNIRRKLGIHNAKKNLQTLLNEME